jgi:hypothetical protein
MSKVVILDNSSVTIWYHPETKIVHHEMHKFTFGDTFKTVLAVGLEELKKNHAAKWLSDDRKNPVTTQENQDWVRTQWLPGVKESDWKYWAIVQPEKDLAKAGMEKFAQKCDNLGITVRLFNNPEDALAWLESV